MGARQDHSSPQSLDSLQDRSRLVDSLLDHSRLLSRLDRNSTNPLSPLDRSRLLSRLGHSSTNPLSPLDRSSTNPLPLQDRNSTNPLLNHLLDQSTLLSHHQLPVLLSRCRVLIWFSSLQRGSALVAGLQRGSAFAADLQKGSAFAADLQKVSHLRSWPPVTLSPRFIGPFTFTKQINWIDLLPVEEDNHHSVGVLGPRELAVEGGYCQRHARFHRQPVSVHSITRILIAHTCSPSAPNNNRDKSTPRTSAT
ncbi:uncharacterized protein LOC122871368 [Siniperca chuatsi]|uniref:uncharacterized protein LOC122871368 n=1 Tax=Siniperca chuatsi TaxID=119488 RepID=UPI001CE0BD9E|nr:uncharacterized protein LOC122871368 [Siniperca chuatsi]XP_044042336.1 uncharacterized protein LOC122871368 [Siniperca chuatsi]